MTRFLLIWCLLVYFCNTLPYATARLINTTENEEVSPPSNVCTTEICRNSANEILKNMDPDVKPCDDFYKFACGRFLRENTIPPDEFEFSTHIVIANKIQNQLRKSMEEETSNDELKPIKLAKIIYKACINKAAIEKKGLTPLLDTLKSLGGWPLLEGDNWIQDNFNWTDCLLKLNELGYSTNFLINLSIVSDPKNITKQILLLDHTKYDKPRVDALDNEFIYYAYVYHLAVKLGANHVRALQEVRDIPMFESWLRMMTFHYESNSTYMTVAELQRKYPSIPWLGYIQQMLPSDTVIDENEVVLVDNPEYFHAFETLMNQTSKRKMANYILHRTVLNSLPLLSDDIRNVEQDYGLAMDEGFLERHERWKECVDMVSQHLPLVADELYRKYYSEDSIRNVGEIAENIKKQFRTILKNVDWIDNGTRSYVLNKLDAMKMQIGFTSLDNDKLEKIHKDLVLNEREFFYSFLNLSRFSQQFPFRNLHFIELNNSYPVFAEVANSNAFYSDFDNKMILPAGTFQGINFNNERPKYMNYAGIGYIIGHEIVHGFDGEHRKHDKKIHSMKFIWSAEAEKNFLSKIQCIIDQYGNYTVEGVGLNLNGTLAQNENIADNVGVKIAYLAYKDWLKRNGPEQTLPGLSYSPKQMFWTSYANSWCTVYRQSYLRDPYTLKNGYSLAEFRLIGPLSNIPEFAEDFNCPVGSKMNPEKKCTVW